MSWCGSGSSKEGRCQLGKCSLTEKEHFPLRPAPRGLERSTARLAPSATVVWRKFSAGLPWLSLGRNWRTRKWSEASWEGRKLPSPYLPRRRGKKCEVPWYYSAVKVR